MRHDALARIHIHEQEREREKKQSDYDKLMIKCSSDSFYQTEAKSTFTAHAVSGYYDSYSE